MNDSVLRGFCPCGSVVQWDPEFKIIADIGQHKKCRYHAGDCFPVLSPKQIEIIKESDEFDKFIKTECPDGWWSLHPFVFLTLLIRLVEDNPFLVAKILAKMDKFICPECLSVFFSMKEVVDHGITCQKKGEKK